MHTIKRALARAGVCALLTSALIPGTVSTALADDTGAQSEAVATALELAPPVDAADAAAQRDGSLAAETASGSADVSIPSDASGAVGFEGSAGTEVAVGIPGAGEGTVEDGVMVYENTAPSTDIVVQPTAEGARALILVAGPEAPTAFPFPVTVPDGGMLVLDEEGGAVVLDQSAAPVLQVAIPWAKDATGRSVPTHFEIVGTQLVQRVDHHQAGVVYPVAADPSLGWVKGVVKRWWKRVLVNRAVVWWYESRGYTCDWWASAWTAPVACYQTAG